MIKMNSLMGTNFQPDNVRDAYIWLGDIHKLLKAKYTVGQVE